MISLLALNVSFAEINLKLYVQSQEVFTLQDNLLSDSHTVLNGRIDYKIKKFRIKKDGVKDITQEEVSDTIRTFEVLNEHTIKMTHLESGYSAEMPAKIILNEAGEFESFHVSAQDYKAGIDPFHSIMDKGILSMIKSKLLSKLPVDIKLEMSDLACFKVEGEEKSEVQNLQIECVQEHFLNVGY